MQPSKIINDPVHGFIEIPKGLLLDIIDTVEFQRLRRIRQLALSSLVYPGAIHSRFNHCIGAMHLCREALNTLRIKGVEISEEEYEATLAAILLHDIGHGPFSHALESVILQGLHHERMSRAIMDYLNARFKGRLDLAIRIFEGQYPRKFLHQLVSSQLDMDRMDYLVRDSYFTGVVEGLVSADRIIKTLNVHQDRLVVESKGIYSVEKFIVARRLMYWQVYLHRAVLSAEYMIVHILRRAKALMYKGTAIWMNEALRFLFSQNNLLVPDIDDQTIQRYVEVDDEDILYALKQWSRSEDKVLSLMSQNLLRRKLLKSRFDDKPLPESEEKKLRAQLLSRGFSPEEAAFFVFRGDVSNFAYMKMTEERINILGKDGTVSDLAEASDMGNIAALSTPVKKHFICYPGEGFFE